MRHTRLWVVATIIASIILLGFALSVPHTRDIVDIHSVPTATTSTPVVALRDSFRKGVHTITGSIEAPNPCASLSVDAVPAPGDTASSTGGILVELSMTPSEGICLEQPFVITFSTTIAAPASLPLSATVNGSAASTTAL